MIDHSSQSTLGPDPSRSRFRVQRCVMLPSTKSWMLYNFCFVKFLPSCMVEAAEPSWPHFGPARSWVYGFRVRSKAWRLRLDQINYWEGAVQLLFRNDWPWLQKYMGHRSFRIQIMDLKMWCAPTKTGMPYNFCFIKFSPSQMVESAEAGQMLFRAPLTLGVRVWVCNSATNLSRIEEYPNAKFHHDWSSGLDFYSRYTQTYTHTHTHTHTLQQASH